MTRIAARSLLYTGVIAKIIGLIEAADCSQSRAEGDPTGKQIENALIKGNSLSNICAGNFSPQNSTDNTFNNWYYCEPELSCISN
jgi:hypothetical protein